MAVPPALPAPYYEDAQVTLYLGDCREILPLLAPASVDLVCTDPPFGQTSLQWDRIVRGWPALARPLLKPSGSLWVFGTLKSHIATAGDFADWRLAQDVIYEKHNGSGSAADRFRRVHEQIAQWYCAQKWAGVYKDPQKTHDADRRRVWRRTGGLKHYGKIRAIPYLTELGGPRLMRSVIRARSMHGKAINPTEKPLAILMPLIRYSCPPGGLVLDPFAGSCSTLEAARLLGCRAIGIEAREEQCASAAARLRQRIMRMEAAT